MSQIATPDCTGTVANFSSALISNDGIPYFEFALTVMPFPPPPAPPTELVLYTNLRQYFAPAVVAAVTLAWANRATVDVYFDHSIQQPHIVLGVVPAALNRGQASDDPPPP